MALQEELEIQGNFLFKYRGYLPLLILVFGFIVFYQTYPKSEFSDDEYLLYQFICLAVGLFGVLIRAYTVGHTPKNTSGRNTSEGQIADELNSTGIYSTVRHPLYVGNFFMWLGVTMLTQNFWFTVAFVFMYWVYYERIMFAEEQFLRGKFGDVYLKWAAQTPAFIPSYSKFSAPKYSFNIKKVLRNEKAGILYLFLLFFVFNRFADYIKNNTFTFEWNVWSIMLSVVIFYYILIKVLGVKE